MTHTILEQLFGFDADDLAANREGKLSASQLQSKERDLAQLGRIKTSSKWMRVVFVAPFFMTLLLFALMLLKGVSPLRLPFLQLAIIALVGVGGLLMVHFRFRIILQEERNLNIGYVVASDPIKLRWFIAIPIGRSRFSTYRVTLDRVVLELNEEIFGKLELDGTYRFYYWSEADRNQNKILSVELLSQHEPIPTPTLMEQSFGFGTQDLIANRTGILSENQRRRMEFEFFMQGREAMFATGLALFLLVVWTGALILSRVPIFLITIALALWVLFATWRDRYTRHRKLIRGQVAHTDNVQKKQFLEALDGDEVAYFYDGGQVNFRLSKYAFDALDPNTAYRIYYWPLQDNQRVNLILSIELIGKYVTSVQDN